jgi:GT2 family glycosyltransferase
VINREEFNSDVEHFGDVRVVYENNRGYSNVRNTAIRNTPPSSNLIFIDDDEIVTLKWFESLMKKHEKFPNNILFGPVFSTSERDVISYRNRFRKQFIRMRDEKLVKHASTANMLIPGSLLEKGLVNFDPVFNQAGSEDTDLCFRIIKHGYKIRYVKDAVIHEVEKFDRFEKTYLEKRFIRDVSNYSFIIRKNSGKWQVLRRFFTLLVRIIFYSTASCFSASSALSLKKKAYVSSLGSLINNKLKVSI